MIAGEKPASIAGWGTSPVHVVCVGACTLDTIVQVARHPEADERVRAQELRLAGGGPAATAAVTLARLGVETLFIGATGDDDAGATVRDDLEAEGVDLSELTVVPGARSAQSVVVVAGETRAICAFPGTLPPLALSERARELCRTAAWVHVDHVGYGTVPREVRLSIDGGNPIDDLDLRGAALYAPAERALAAQFGGAQEALAAGAELVVVTRGDAGSVAYTRDGDVVEASAFPVDAVSTLGAGDVFHGALLAQLAREVLLADALAAANACAALSCRTIDARSGIPTADELEAALVT